MSSSSTIQEWQKEVEQRFPQMKVGQTRVLAQASYAMMMTMHCGTTTISHWLATYLEESPNTVRQRIREWYYEAKAKRGRKRRAINVEEWFGDLLRWVLVGWEGEKRVVLALDATNNGTRFTSLSIGVVIHGCLIPVAWKMLKCNAKGAWKAHWLRLLALLRGVIPDEWQVVAMTDAGLYAPWLYEAIQENHWHPMMRVDEQMGFRAEGGEAFRPLGEIVARRGCLAGAWSEKGERKAGTVLGAWEAGYERKLAVVTDLPVEQAQVGWYQMRFWTEDGFKDQKRGGWRWEQTKMTDPERASRLWFVLAVTMLWAMRVGSAAAGKEQVSRPRARRQPGRPRKVFRRPRACEQSVIVRGQQCISIAAMQGKPLPLGRLRAAPWPEGLYAVGKAPASWERRRKRKEQRRKERHRKATWKQRHQAKAAQEREREAKRQEKRERRQVREQEQQAKRRARQEHAPQPEESRPTPKRTLPTVSAARPSPPSREETARLVPGEMQATTQATTLPASGNVSGGRSAQFPPCSPRSKNALVFLYHGQLLPVRRPLNQEKPP